MTEVSNIRQMPEHPQSSGFREGTPVHLTSFLPLDAVTPRLRNLHTRLVGCVLMGSCHPDS